jgi:Na+(H+)/acetate symporter ActP
VKEKRKSNKTTFIVLTVALALVAILVAVKVTHTPVNNVSIGWIEHKQSDLWEADYSYFTGTQTSNLQSQKAKLNIDVKTDEGSLEISIKDADDNTIFSETISETISFSVDVREKVIVSVSGKEHNGGFTISY